jgi:glucose-1-phosphate cytidylyltransferase
MKAATPVPVIILCGGQGIRMRQGDQDLPKPLVRIGDQPLLWHVMNTFAAHGHTDFVLALGHQAEAIKSYFFHRQLLANDFTIDFGTPPTVTYHGRRLESGWRVSCVDTGARSGTAARIVRAAQYAPGDTVMVTYADGVADVDVAALLRFHRDHGRLGTITAVHPPGRFGLLKVGLAGEVLEFEEKPDRSAELVNGGYMVFDRAAISRYMGPHGDAMLEGEPLTDMASDGELMAFRHDGFWQPVDTPMERERLDRSWAAGHWPWPTHRADQPSH